MTEEFYPPDSTYTILHRFPSKTDFFVKDLSGDHYLLQCSPTGFARPVHVLKVGKGNMEPLTCYVSSPKVTIAEARTFALRAYPDSSYPKKSPNYWYPLKDTLEERRFEVFAKIMGLEEYDYQHFRVPLIRVLRDFFEDLPRHAQLMRPNIDTLLRSSRLEWGSDILFSDFLNVDTGWAMVFVQRWETYKKEFPYEPEGDRKAPLRALMRATRLHQIPNDALRHSSSRISLILDVPPEVLKFFGGS